MRIAMKTAVTMLILSTSTAAYAGWVKFGENARMVSYYEPVKTSSPGPVTIWVLYDYKTEQESPRSGRRYHSQKGQQEVDCDGHRSRTVFFTWHADQMGEGAVVYTGSRARSWEPDSPLSFARALSSEVCTRM